MRNLSLPEMNHVAGGDGYFKITINADVSPNCAALVSATMEKYVAGEISNDQANIIFASAGLSEAELSAALNNMTIVYWT